VLGDKLFLEHDLWNLKNIDTSKDFIELHFINTTVIFKNQMHVNGWS
jgi:hypothetical protein